MKIRKKEITITVLLALVCAAAYLNFGSFRDFAATPASGENEDVQPAAVINETNGDIFATERMNRERARSESIENLKQIAQDPTQSSDAKTRAERDINFLSKCPVNEKDAEIQLAAKGIDEALVMVSEGGATVLVRAQQLNTADIAKIKDIVSATCGVDYADIKITQLSSL